MGKVGYERLVLPSSVVATLPVTDVAAVVDAINRYRSLCAAERVAKRKKSFYNAEWKRRRDNGLDND